MNICTLANDEPKLYSILRFEMNALSLHTFWYHHKFMTYLAVLDIIVLQNEKFGVIFGTESEFSSKGTAIANQSILPILVLVWDSDTYFLLLHGLHQFLQLIFGKYYR